MTVLLLRTKRNGTEQNKNGTIKKGTRAELIQLKALVLEPLTVNTTINGLNLCIYQTKLLIQALNATQGHKRRYLKSYISLAVWSTKLLYKLRFSSLVQFINSLITIYALSYMQSHCTGNLHHICTVQVDPSHLLRSLDLNKIPTEYLFDSF